jgi:dihydrolipoamide dehydrogenase
MSGETNNHTELAVIGAGPGGYTAAFHAADLGMDVTLITEEPLLGGVCLHRGCVPSKVLLHVAGLMNQARAAGHWGLEFDRPRVDLEALRHRKDEVAGTLANGLSQLAARRKVKVAHARASFVDSQTLQLHSFDNPSDGRSQQLTCTNIILASGSSPSMPGPLRVSDPRVMDSSNALALADIPERLLVIGGGYIGLEIGTIYAALGSRITLVELTDGLLPGVDRDLVRILSTRLADVFENVHLKGSVEKLVAREDATVATLTTQSGQTEQAFDRVLVATGRSPNSSGLGLERTGVQIDPAGFVRVDRQQRTDQPAIFAIGDVVGGAMLAHKAAREAKIAVEAIAGRSSDLHNMLIPAVVFTDPEIVWCGLTETQAKLERRRVSIARFPWAASGRAATLNRTDGLTKLVFDPDTEKLLGAGIVGCGASELIAEGVLAIQKGATAGDIAGAVHPHPTLSETVAEAAELFYGPSTHLFRPKRR